MNRAKFFLRIESERLAMNNYDTYFLMSVETMPSGEVIELDLYRDSDLNAIRAIARKRGCMVVEAL
jgi:hypothetical protein